MLRTRLLEFIGSMEWEYESLVDTDPTHRLLRVRREIHLLDVIKIIDSHLIFTIARFRNKGDYVEYSTLFIGRYTYDKSEEIDELALEFDDYLSGSH